MIGRKDDRKLIVDNFWSGIEPHGIYETDLGWDKSSFEDARSNDPEVVFRYYIEIVGFNMAFYYLDDGCFYHIFTERWPIKVYRMLPNPDWDGKYLIKSAIGADDTHCKGEEIYSTTDAAHIWDELKIGGKPIGEVLERSLIMELD